MKVCKGWCILAAMTLLISFGWGEISFAERGDILDYSSFDVTPLVEEGLTVQPVAMDVRQVRWGMSPEEVLRRENVPSYKEIFRGGLLEITVPSTSIAGIPCSILYIFSGNCLSSIFCTFHSEPFRLNEDVGNYRHLQALLEEKYGASLEKEILWNNPESPYVANPQSFGMAVALEDLSYHTLWNTGSTLIALTLEGEDLRSHLTLYYRSSTLEEEEAITLRKTLLLEL